MTGVQTCALPICLSAAFYGGAESAAGLAALLGGLAAGVLAGRLPFRRLHRLAVLLGVCVLLAGGAMLLPLGPVLRFAPLVLAFCGGQACACCFSIFAVSAIQQRTPEHMTGKVMACVSTISMCAQPLGQMLYGLWFDASPGWVVLLASGAAIFALGVCSRKLFEKW